MATAQKIITALGWQIIPGEDGRNYENHVCASQNGTRNEPELSFRRGYGADSLRWHISGYVGRGLTEHMPYNTHSPSISINTERPAEAAAKDVRRRLLPNLFALVQVCEERKVSADQNQTDLAATAARLNAQFSGTFEFRQDQSPEKRWTLYHNSTVGNGLFVYMHGIIYADSVSLEHVNLPLDLAERVFAAVAQWYAEQK